MNYLLTHVIWRENGDRCVTLWKYRILRNFAKTFDRSNANKNTGQKKWRIHLCFKHFQLILNEIFVYLWSKFKTDFSLWDNYY